MTSINIFRNTDEYVMYEPGQIIFEEGQPGEVMYAVLEGAVEITAQDKLIDCVEQGGILGEMALIDNSPRSGTARAKAPTKLVPINQKCFMFLVQQTPYFSIQVMQIMAERLRRWMSA